MSCSAAPSLSLDDGAPLVTKNEQHELMTLAATSSLLPAPEVFPTDQPLHTLQNPQLGSSDSKGPRSQNSARLTFSPRRQASFWREDGWHLALVRHTRTGAMSLLRTDVVRCDPAWALLCPLGVVPKYALGHLRRTHEPRARAVRRRVARRAAPHPRFSVGSDVHTTYSWRL